MFRLGYSVGFFFLCVCLSLNAQTLSRSALNLPVASPLIPPIPQPEACCDRKASTIKPPLFIQKILIVIDPGHGGHDIGTQSISKPRYQEKSLNLVTAQFVKSYLKQIGYQVMMTREDDSFISLDKRAQLANTHQPTPALFVSIHYNSAPSAEAQGIEVFFYSSKENKERMLRSKQLAQSVLKHMLVQTKAKSRGVKQANYVVIRDTTIPAVLVEGGFVTNEAELTNLKDPSYLKRLAWGIVQGIEEYLNAS